MKKIFRKNQLVITALALMIAIAGYFSYMNSNMEDETTAAQATAGTDVYGGEYEISDEDTLTGEIFTDEGTGDELAMEDAAGEDDGMEVFSADTTETAAEAQEEAGSVDVENPGEAVLTSTTVANMDYAADMKLNREQVRSKNKEMLLEIVNNEAIADNLKQDAVDKMVAMTDIAEKEAAAEMLLEAKGFSDVVVSITDNSCDVVLNMGEVTDAKRAQVEDIVKRKTETAAENIIITPIVVDDADQ